MLSSEVSAATNATSFGRELLYYVLTGAGLAPQRLIAENALPGQDSFYVQMLPDETDWPDFTDSATGKEAMVRMGFNLIGTYRVGDDAQRGGKFLEVGGLLLDRLKARLLTLQEILPSDRRFNSDYVQAEFLSAYAQRAYVALPDGKQGQLRIIGIVTYAARYKNES